MIEKIRFIFKNISQKYHPTCAEFVSQITAEALFIHWTFPESHIIRQNGYPAPPLFEPLAQKLTPPNP